MALSLRVDDREDIRTGAAVIKCSWVRGIGISHASSALFVKPALGEIVQERRELARANRIATLGQLSASLSHEMSQPIGAARNNARAALRFLNRESPDVEAVREALSCVVSDIDRAGAVLDRIRDMIKNAPERSENFDLNDVIKEVIELTHAEMVTGQIKLNAQLAYDLPLVKGDRIQIQQVMLNLIVNAKEAMSAVVDGQRVLLITTAADGPENVLVSVRDSGPGIASTHRESIFDAFFTTKPNGIGLGLSICRTIVESHGGRLWVEPNTPRGAAFIFTVRTTSTHLVP